MNRRLPSSYRRHMLSLLTPILALGFGASSQALSDAVQRDLDAQGAAIRPAATDPEIRRAIAGISATQIEHTIRTLVAFHNRSTLSSMDKDLPPGQGVSAAADWIESEFNRYAAACGGCLEVHRDTFTESPQSRIAQPTTITNIYAILRGSDPTQARRMFLVTGHYDSRNTTNENTHDEAPGANDDASGVAVSLECARVLAKLKLPGTLVFVAVAGEEQGLNGSRHLAKLAKSEGWQLEGVFNNDIVGGNTTPGDTLQDKSAVRVFSEGIPSTATPEQIKMIEALGAESDSPSRELARTVTDISKSYFAAGGAAKLPKSKTAAAFAPVLIFRHDRFLRGGDHASFNQEGFPAVRFTEWREDFNHQHQNVRMENGVQFGDLIKYVDFSYVANVARLNAATMATLAAAPPQPVDVKIVTHNLDNGSTINWKAPDATAGAMYEIVWRETSAPDWQRFAAAAKLGDAATGANHSVTLPVSKDNVIFAVRSVDAAGHRGVAVPVTP